MLIQNVHNEGEIPKFFIFKRIKSYHVVYLSRSGWHLFFYGIFILIIHVAVVTSVKRDYVYKPIFSFIFLLNCFDNNFVIFRKFPNSLGPFFILEKIKVCIQVIVAETIYGLVMLDQRYIKFSFLLNFDPELRIVKPSIIWIVLSTIL